MSEQIKKHDHRPLTRTEKIAAGALTVALAGGPVYAQLQETPADQQEAAKYVMGMYGELALGVGMIAASKKIAEANRMHAQEQAVNMQTYVVQPPNTQQ